MTPEEFCLLQFDRDPALSIPTIRITGIDDLEEALPELMRIEDCARIVMPVDLIMQRHELTATLDRTPLALETTILLDGEQPQAGLFVAQTSRPEEPACSRSNRNRIKLLELVCDLFEICAAGDQRSLEGLESENKKLQRSVEELDETKSEVSNLQARLANLTEDLSGTLRQLQNEQERSLAAEAEIAVLKRRLKQASIRNRIRRIFGIGDSSDRA